VKDKNGENWYQRLITELFNKLILFSNYEILLNHIESEKSGTLMPMISLGSVRFCHKSPIFKLDWSNSLQNYIYLMEQ
jgi:hypothetical protein